MKPSNIILAILVLLSGGFFVYSLMGSKSVQAPPANVSQLGSRTSGEGSVEVVVQPRDLSEKNGVWALDVTLDTHSGDLADDMAKVSALADKNGKTYPPLAWEGDPPGGHHRNGTLTFAPLSPRPDLITLVIRDVGGVSERKFTWTLSE